MSRYYSQYEEHMDFHYATDAEWDQADAWQSGQERPDLAWICTDRDVWHQNPFYTGAPVPHPESYEELDGIEVEHVETIEIAGRHEYDEDLPF